MDPEAASGGRRDGAGDPHLRMVHESDLPCSDCGAALVERDVEPPALSLSSSSEGPLSLAECPACGARYYPERALARLGGQTGRDRVGEGR